MKSVLRPRVAGLVVSICALLAVPGAAQAYTVTLHIHGAGTVAELTARNLPGCTIPPSGLSNASVTDCVMGSTSGFWNFGDVVNLGASVNSVAAARGWVFEKWVDGTASGQIDCDDSPAHVGDRSSPTCQFQIFQNLYIDLYFHDVSGPQDTRFTSAAQPSPTSATTASFTFDAPSDPDAVFQCKLDRPGQLGSYGSCTQSPTYSVATSGDYTLTVRALDRSGNVDATPVSRTWTVDATPPTTTISGGPAEESLVNSRTAGFSLSASETVSRYECSLDSGAFSTCSPAPSFSSLGDGAHTFQARSVDQVSNLGPAATRHWTVDATAPDTSISSGPADGSTTSANVASFAFASEPGAGFQCALDGGAFAACASPFSTPALADGAHTFAVRASDGAGNLDASPATRGWTVSTPTSTGGTPTSTGSTTSTDSGAQPGGSPPTGTGVVPVAAINPATPGAAPGAVSVSWFVAGARTSAKSLKVTGLKSGSTVRATCKGKGCPFASKTLTAKAGKVDLTKYFKGRRLAKKTVLELRVAASGLLTRVFTYKVRAGAAPSRTTGCLAAGASKPGACPTA